MTTRSIDSLKTALSNFAPGAATDREKIVLAQAALQCGVALLDQVADATEDEYARAYMVDPLRALAGGDPSFTGHWFDLGKWLDRLDDTQPRA